MGNTILDSILKNTIWILAGILAGVVVSLMIISGSGSLNQFYDGGAVYDVLSYHRTNDAAGAFYDTNAGVYTVTEQEAYIFCELSGMEKDWNYIILDLSGMQGAQIQGTAEYFDLNGNLVKTQDVTLREGRNTIEADAVYSRMQIWINQQAGVTFSIDKMQFREKLVDFSWKTFAAITGIVFVVYLLLTGLIRRYIHVKWDWYGIWDFLQGLYILAGEKMGRYIGKLDGKIRSRLRTVLFLFQIIYMQIIQNLGLYETNAHYKLQMLVCSVVVCLAAALCYEGNLERKNWKNRLTGVFTALWVMACISDFIIAKRYSFLGYIMFFVIGFFYFMWNNMADRRQILTDFIHAVIISFVLTSLFCFVCRPWTPGQRYLGSYYNPGMYAMYVLFVFIALLGMIDRKINTDKKVSAALIAEIAAGVLALALLWKTQSSSGIIPAVLVIGIFGFKEMILSGSKRTCLRGIACIAVMAALVLPVFAGTEWALINLPQKLNTQVYFPKDGWFTSADSMPGTLTVYAQESTLKQNRIIRKLSSLSSLEEFTTARNFYWLGYLREMNLLGHNNKVNLWGGNRWPHNGVIAIMYRYGVFAVIPYVFMLLIYLWRSWKYMIRKKEYGYFLFASAAASMILILMENLELPFLFLCWTTMYLTMGIHFMQDESDEQKSEGKKCRA